jgi:tyrosine-protein kinase Etk/Wzc
MNEAQIMTPELSDKARTDELSIVDVLAVLKKRKKLLWRIPVVVALAATVICFAIPNVYKATTRLMPPQQSQSSASALLSQLGGVAGMASGIGSLKSSNDLYVSMLRSRTIAERLVAKFDLKKVYKTDSQEKALKILADNTTVTSGKDGLITIEVDGKDQKGVAPLANAYVQEISQLTKTLAVTEASRRRVFFEQQLEMAKNNLAAVETSLKSSLDNSGLISVDGESRALIETIGRVRAQLSAKEIQLSSMRAFVTATNPAYRKVEEELNSLRNELGRLENGGGAGRDQNAQSTGDQKGLANTKTLRDVKYYQMLYELLAKQYEAARLDEAKDPAIIQVLDPAVEPEREYKPKRAILVIAAALVALLGAVAYIFVSEVARKTLQPNLAKTG